MTKIKQPYQLSWISLASILAAAMVAPLQAAYGDDLKECQNQPDDPRCQNLQTPLAQLEPESELEEAAEESTEESELEESEDDPQEAETSEDDVIKVNLKTSGPDNEWIRLERRSDPTGALSLQIYHTVRVRQELLSDAVGGAIGAISPVPLPFGVNFHDWSDHQTLRLAFQPDRCPDVAAPSLSRSVPLNSQPSNLQPPSLQPAPACSYSGTETLVLPAGTDIYAGKFTVEYQEEDLVRSITFRLPDN